MIVRPEELQRHTFYSYEPPVQRRFIPPKIQSKRLNHDGLTAYNNIAFFDLVQEAGEHGLHVEAPIVSEAVLVEVGLKIMTANTVVDSADPALYEAPESVDGLRVNISSNVDLLAMVDPAMRVPACPDPVVRLKIIGKDHRARQHVFLQKPAQSVSLNVGSDESANLAFALNHTDNGSLVGSASAFSLAPSSVVRLIHFDP